MSSIYLGIVIFLIVLAVFDLVVGVSNDAVNFLNSAIGAKVASFRTIVIVAAIGIFAGASLSNGMMDVARHGIMTPQYYSFFDVMSVFLAVMVTDVILLDVFNTLGMPTSTTVSMVFELLGGAFAVSILKTARGAVDASGNLLHLGDLLNTEKALSVIISIFLSVAIAFVLGVIVQWIARLVFSFTYRVNGKTTDVKGKMGSLTGSSLRIGIFGGIAVTCIIWFLLINGLKGSSFMTPELKQTISDYTWYIIGGGFVIFSIIMTILSALKVPVLKFIVLLGTFALAMAFAGNDLVNFVGVPLTGLDAYQNWVAAGSTDANSFLMECLMSTAHTPVAFLVIAGIVMVLSLTLSKKAQNVVKTSVDLSRQDEGDEMFGSSSLARTIVRHSRKIAESVEKYIPSSVQNWIDSRFNSEDAILPEGAAFDLIRASVNLVLAGLLVALGTSFKLPLSTTYVTFMVAMGSSLADRAWSRESAVFRITGVLSVIGGWFLTAGVAFVVCFLVTNVMLFGKFVAMVLAIVLAIYILLKSNRAFAKKKQNEQEDVLFKQIVKSKDPQLNWELLKQHVEKYNDEQLTFIRDAYERCIIAFFGEKYSDLKVIYSEIEDHRKDIKRQRRREIIALRKLEPIKAIEKNTYYFINYNSISQMLYCLKRINEPCREHVGNNFTPVDKEYIHSCMTLVKESTRFQDDVRKMLQAPKPGDREEYLTIEQEIEKNFTDYRQSILDKIPSQQINIDTMAVLLNLVQESQELLAAYRHLIRAMLSFLE